MKNRRVNYYEELRLKREVLFFICILEAALPKGGTASKITKYYS